MKGASYVKGPLMSIRLATVRTVSALALATAVALVALLQATNGFEFGKAIAADPGDCISQTPQGCYGDPQIEEERTSENTNIVSDPTQGSIADALSFGASLVVEDRPTMTASQVTFHNARVSRKWRTFSRINRVIRPVNCRTVTTNLRATRPHPNFIRDQAGHMITVTVGRLTRTVCD